MASRQTRRRDKSGLSEEGWLLAGLLVVLGALLLVWVAWVIGCLWAGVPVSVNPFAALVEVAAGRRRWPPQASIAAGAVAVAAGVGARWGGRRWRGRSPLDAAARTMQPTGTLTGVTGDDMTALAARLLADAPPQARARVGVSLGRTVSGNRPVYLSWEMPATIVSGTRTGKTMAWAIPAVLDAPGPVLSTSNKPDLLVHTRLGRERKGRVWLCDLQGITGRPQLGFWVDYLARVTSMAAARKLASFFATASREPGARVDSYFDGGAVELLALYMLAAARAGGDLLHVAEWLGRDQDQTPQLILTRFSDIRAAQRITEMQSVTARQRDGLFDMARRFLNVLSDQSYAIVATPPARRRISVHGDARSGISIDVDRGPVTHQLPRFDPVAFVTSTDSLYPLSMEGADSAAPLMTALVGQVLEAALAVARSRPSGRLAVPLVGVLDEAANCCKLSELPNYYTYAGGHGVVLMTFLQVLEQGRQIWGEEGLNKMFAQSVEAYGGGIGDVTYLKRWSDLIGLHDVSDRSVSSGRGGSVTRSWRAEPILDASELAALPKDRAIIRIPGNKPVLCRKVWWQDTEHAAVITESLRRYSGADSMASHQHPGGPGQGTALDRIDPGGWEL
ncbi:type IV secretory system conjugative DNA transfer family protein [Nocardia sp. alder85J]|uniref:type IV secretory system conjugative DNA transfer family protein n=1 Tax=Nocardia sp. alder85J TaxID=2862949 RepID=UPI001CD458EC|nr:TraM recognition domain-containing protein [Nocardia sp. alder85J]MCX4098419.1 TraM recognition domain-containing protein [Nocardia sp. alder85J]